MTTPRRTPAREVARELAAALETFGQSLAQQAENVDRLTAAIEQDRRETIEACAKLCDVSGDTFCPDVDPGELFTGGARLAQVRIRSLSAPSPETGTAAVPTRRPLDKAAEWARMSGVDPRDPGPAPEPAFGRCDGFAGHLRYCDACEARAAAPAPKPVKPPATCGALANDGTACTRLPHPESPDYHTDGTEYCWIGGTGRTPAAGTAPRPTDDGPVVQASTETRALIATLTRRWPVAPEPRPICPGCKQEIDPDTCGCGDAREGHGYGDGGHGFIPMGCDCFRSRE